MEGRMATVRSTLDELEATTHVHPDALELAELLEPSWPQIKNAIARTGRPTNLDDADKDDDADEDDDADKDIDWKAQSRKHEREKKAARKESARLAAELKTREDADKSDQDKAIDAARDEGRTAALTEAQEDRRHDRLEVAVARNAAKKFADIDDALMHIERRIKNGTIDADDIFDADGKVQNDALKAALDELLEEKAHLGIDKETRVEGESDAGKGTGTGKDAGDMSVDDHLKAAQAANK